MFKICPNCGAHNTATAKFCTRCGTSLAGVVATAETAVQSAQPTSENEASTANTAAVSEQSSVPSSLTSSSAQNQPVTPQQAQSQVTPPDNSQQQVPPQPAHRHKVSKRLKDQHRQRSLTSRLIKRSNKHKHRQRSRIPRWRLPKSMLAVTGAIWSTALNILRL